ncbi:hypothetical protein B0O80DRAFT_437075 [Mortierella sp. GBAus27b]|nr:hypothetical protein BGX31_003906 [Mortierella sp. GBA43]KAI8361230.1 hypothetical protein B0O80DRAFT_437075 [Mortierella sp. GBAus27b]
MGCVSSKNLDDDHYVPPNAYSLPQQVIPPSTLPEGWVSQFDLNKRRLYYIFPQTAHVTWSHPLGPEADAQELARYYQIKQLQQERFGKEKKSAYTTTYNRQGGMGRGAAMAIGVMAGAAITLATANALAGALDPSLSDDLIPAEITGDYVAPKIVYVGGEFIPASSMAEGGGEGGDGGGDD